MLHKRYYICHDWTTLILPFIPPQDGQLLHQSGEMMVLDAKSLYASTIRMPIPGVQRNRLILVKPNRGVRCAGALPLTSLAMASSMSHGVVVTSPTIRSGIHKARTTA